MRIILVHGYKSSPEKNFFPWLSNELKRRGFEVICPELPNPENPDVVAWTETLVKEVKVLTKDDVIVGHSLGGAAALRMLEAVEARTTPQACVLISAPWFINAEQLRGFFLTELDHDVLMWRASKFVVIHSKNDPVIPFSHAERYAQVFHARLVSTEADGHFDGVEYPILLDEIVKVANEPIEFAPGMSLPDQYSDIIK